MERVVALTAFYKAILNDVRISPAHISLYMALFQLWKINNFQSPVIASSKEIMPMAKIDSRATYHKCMNDLVDNGYIRYIPSCNPFFKSFFFLERLEENNPK